MTPHGRHTLEVLVKLETSVNREEGFTATEIMANCDDLPDRVAPVMTVSSYLTHLKRQGLVERKSSSDKSVAWWSSTDKGRKELHAAQA